MSLRAFPAPADASGLDVTLCAERALHWPAHATLFVADVHLGKAAAFRAACVPLPRRSTQADLAPLAALPAQTGARLPCFVLGTRRAILPAFGRFTGLAFVSPGRGERLVAVAGSRLFALPPVKKGQAV